VNDNQLQVINIRLLRVILCRLLQDKNARKGRRDRDRMGG